MGEKASVSGEDGEVCVDAFAAGTAGDGQVGMEGVVVESLEGDMVSKRRVIIVMKGG